MNKILIKLLVPAVNGEYDVSVPTTLDIAALTNLLAEGVKDMSKGRYAISGLEMLNGKDPDLLLDPRKTLADYGFYNGSVLTMI